MKYACLALTTATLVALSAPAHAQAPGEAQPRAAEPTGEQKDPSTALLLSLGGTAASVALMVAGASSSGSSGDSLIQAGLLSSLVTPSLGHWYAGEYLTAGLGMRLGGGVLAVYGLAQALGCIDSESDSCNGDTGGGAMLVGAGLYIGGTLYDIATAPSAARRWNEHHLQLAPTMVGTGVHPGMGVGLAGTF